MTDNGFPYFQFHIDRWHAGKINAFDLEEQGFYLSLCISAWVSQGAFSVCSTTVQRRYRKPAQWIADTMTAFMEVGIIERDGDKYRIKFIDEQIELLTGKRQQRVDAGKASAAKRAASAALLSTESNTETRVEKSREEKSSTLNSRSTVVQRSFDSFWNVYPKKVGKKAAAKAWDKAKDKPDVQSVIDAVKAQSQSQAWTKDGGQYIPNPATWLNEGRWDDQTQTATTKARNFI